jgi:hypothetical protein
LAQKKKIEKKKAKDDEGKSMKFNDIMKTSTRDPRDAELFEKVSRNGYLLDGTNASQLGKTPTPTTQQKYGFPTLKS